MIHLSPRSIKLLKTDNKARYNWYVNKKRNFDFNPYSCMWNYLHQSIDNRAKHWIYRQEYYLSMMITEFEKNNSITKDWDEDFISKFNLGLSNFLIMNLDKPNVSEKEIKKSINKEYWLKIKIDWVRNDFWWDYKFVSKFTKDNDIQNKYYDQIRFYQYVLYKTTLQKMNWKVFEINTTKEWYRIIEFIWSDIIIQQTEKEIENAILKATRLQTLDYTNIL